MDEVASDCVLPGGTPVWVSNELRSVRPSRKNASMEDSRAMSSTRPSRRDAIVQEREHDFYIVPAEAFALASPGRYRVGSTSHYNLLQEASLYFFRAISILLLYTNMEKHNANLYHAFIPGRSI
jgi:hypothetical protein